MSSNYKIKIDLDEAGAMAQGLADYVRGEQIYGNTGGSFASNMPRLTVGALLMRLRRLDVLRDSMQKAQQNELETAIHTWQSTRNDWRVHYEKKVIREIDSRLKSMQQFFKECRENQRDCLNNYRPELLKRTIIQELLREMSALNIESDMPIKVDLADGKFRGYMRPDDFQWADELKAVYPKNEFWWLYQKPPAITDKK